MYPSTGYDNATQRRFGLSTPSRQRGIWARYRSCRTGPFAGDDPVNGEDPSGDISCGSRANCESILSRSQNAFTAFEYFLKTDHFTAAQAAGFVGNFEVESGVQPDCVGGAGVCQPLGKIVPYYSPFGIAQWLGGRTEALFSFAKQRGLNRSEAAHSLTVQLDFVSDELGIGPYGRNAGWQERDWADPYITSAGGPDFAAEEVAQYFEGAVGAPKTRSNPNGLQDLSDRQNFASAAYALWAPRSRPPRKGQLEDSFCGLGSDQWELLS